MKLLLSFILVLGFISFSNAFEGLNDGTSLKIFNRINCGSTMTCTRTGNGIFNMESNGLQDQISGTTATTTLTTSLCGSTVVSATDTVVMLPEASSAIGCRFTIVTGSPSFTTDINPDDDDIIRLGADAAGDAIRNSTFGENITLEAVDSTFWVPVSTTGTYTDVN